MSVSTRIRVFIVALLAVVAMTALPSTAEAQRRYRRPVRVVFIGTFGYYPYWLHDPWYRWRPYPGFFYDARYQVAELRIDVEPRHAQVFVDGYYAGIVDDFDGVFQRLRVEPGGRTITIYLEGYRTEERRLYLRPGSDHRLRFTLQPLAPGERSEPPAPAPEPYGRNWRRGDVAGPDEDGARFERDRDDRRRAARARYGTLSLRIRPADAGIYIDGEPWDGAATGGVATIELPEGRHRIEVRREGLPSFTEDVLIRRGRTLTLNVVLE